MKGVLLHDSLGVVTGEVDGCISMMCTDGTSRLRERHRFKLTQYEVCDMVWCLEDELLVSDVKGGVYYLNVAERDKAMVVVEPGADGGAVLRVAECARGNVLHKSIEKGTLTVLVQGDDGRFDVEASFTPPEYPPDARLTPDADAVVFLQHDQLIIFDHSSLTVTSSIHLPQHFTNFLISTDKVYVALWSPSTPRLTLADYEYHTIQQLEGHTTPITSATFDASSTTFFSLSGTKHDFELIKWNVTQLVA
eukprot:TRINITY_DN19551_c0_g1_i1.p1 TRINITY_DN19551_c0_g1~~TRINITY_DN19551_c0_g1_i1.p1  ORF type:complete len:265 (+),score=36.63 TRINITY_DN19551_c0_g1_i1:48-797(+)